MKCKLVVVHAAWLLVAGTSLRASISATLTAKLPSPQLIGTIIPLTFSATDSNPGPVTFRLEIATPQAANFSMVSDFMQRPTFSWTPNVVEGF